MPDKTPGERNRMRCIGLVAHVDAGKTTLTEGLLFACGEIRKRGRVDSRDTFLDTDVMERSRGITIYSKSALLHTPSHTYTLLDTPGHADFGTEMERVLSVLDCAVLLISIADGVNAQVRLLGDLLAHYHVPAVVFVNKTDQVTDGLPEKKAALLAEIRKHLFFGAVDFTNGAGDAEVQENCALCLGQEELLLSVMEGESIPDAVIRDGIRRREIVPVLFGAALRMEGVQELLTLLDRFVPDRTCGGGFAARVFKITRDPAGERETWMRLTGGSLSVRDTVTYPVSQTLSEDEEESVSSLTEKTTGIRLYSGGKWTARAKAEAGDVVAVTGLTKTFSGQGLGEEKTLGGGVLTPALAFEILLPPKTDPHLAFRRLTQLEEAEPTLRFVYDERRKEIRAHLMGQVQKEIVQDLAMRRFGLPISFGTPSVVYEETIARPVEGVGHFEPLRHYAEVHLLMEPGERGSGLTFDTACPSDLLPRHYQNLVLTHLRERRHRGVLTGSLLTDVKITLIAGKAHEKHTEGGDFRQATYRAVRQGLMMAENVLLEPYDDFMIRLPAGLLGRAMQDLEKMHAKMELPDEEGGIAVLRGSAPVISIEGYQESLTAYTKGEGKMSLRRGVSRPCHNPEEVIAAAGYDPELDRGQPSASVFCEHGAGTLIPWYEVRERMHVDSGWRPAEETAGTAGNAEEGAHFRTSGGTVLGTRPKEELSFREAEAKRLAGEDELRAIFERTYGTAKSREGGQKKTVRAAEPLPPSYRKPRPKAEKEYLLVDGYNIIHAWEDLSALAEKDLKAARDRLLDILSDFAGFDKRSLILVFDAYKVAGGQERVMRYHNIDVVYTREAETADQYIEKAAHELIRHYGVTVATSDAVEQIIIFGAGAVRLSAGDLLLEIRSAKAAMREVLAQKQTPRSEPGGTLAEKVRSAMDGQNGTA